MSGFALLYMIFTRLFPIVSIWEIQEGIDRSIPDVTRRLQTYLPAEAPHPTPFT
jgi:hypothetical protein